MPRSTDAAYGGQEAFSPEGGKIVNFVFPTEIGSTILSKPFPGRKNRRKAASAARPAVPRGRRLAERAEQVAR
jgi:hypothetical protein